jgi:adenosylcobinamide hydrolase
MRLQTSFDFIRAEVDKNQLVISSEIPLEVLSSAVLNGGFTTANKIVSIHVPEENKENVHKNSEDLDKELHENPEDILRKAVMRLGFDSDEVVGIMTNADVRNVQVSAQMHNEISLNAFVTAGVKVSATAGEPTISKHGPINRGGTINIILLVDGNLTKSCMVDAVKTATEAKTVALRELDTRSYFSGDPASGTVTDSVIVACTKRGKTVEYAGTATILGELIGKSVKESLKKTLRKEQQFVANRPLTKRLNERGISLAKVATLFLKAHPEIAEKSEPFNEELQQMLSDPKIVPLILAALRLDDDVKAGLTPKDMFDQSTAIDNLQTSVINYIENKNQAKNLKADDASLVPMNNLGPFARGILAAIMTNAYRNLCSKS